MYIYQLKSVECTMYMYQLESVECTMYMYQLESVECTMYAVTHKGWDFGDNFTEFEKYNFLHSGVLDGQHWILSVLIL